MKRIHSETGSHSAAPLPGLKSARREPVELENYVNKRSFAAKVEFRINTNPHTQQQWVYDLTNTCDLLGVLESVTENPAFTQPFVVQYRKPKINDRWSPLWDRGRIESSKYFEKLRLPKIINSARQRALPENRSQNTIYFYAHDGVEYVVQRRVSRELGADTSLAACTTHCSALVFTGRDPFGATIAVVVENANAMRAIRVPEKWPDGEEEKYAAMLAEHLNKRIQEMSVNGNRAWAAKRELSDMWLGKENEIVIAPKALLRWKFIRKSGIDAFGFRGKHVDDAGFSFVEFYFSHSYYAMEAQRALTAANMSWLPDYLRPDAMLERGEYYAPHNRHAFRVYDPITAMERFMCDDGRKWGCWFALDERRCLDMTSSKTAVEGRVTLADREYRCAPQTMRVCVEEGKEAQRCFVDGQWKVVASMVPDLLIGTFDGEMRPPETNAFPQAHRDSFFQISYHTHGIVSKNDSKYLFSYGSIATEEEFQRNLAEVEQTMSRPHADHAASTTNGREEDDANKMHMEIEEMLKSLHDMADDSYDEEYQHLEDMVEESLIDANALDNYKQYFTSEEQEKIESMILKEEEARKKGDQHDDSLGNTDALIGTVFAFDDELEMLREFCEFIQVMQTDVLTGWNMIFDAQWLINRSAVLGSCCARRLGMVPGIETKTRTTVSAAKTRGVFNMVGTVPMDMLYLVLNSKTLDAYNLNHVADVIIGRQKATMPYEMIHRLSRTPYGRRMIGIYCSEDSALVVQIAKKLRPFVTLVQECRENNCPFSTLVNYGSEAVIFCAHRTDIKTLGPAHYDGTVSTLYFPLLPRGKKTKYQGATVFKPDSGDYFDNTVPTLDLNSLYPSVTRDGNLCTTTMINNYHARRLGLSEGAGLNKRPIYDFDQPSMTITYKDSDPHECGFVDHDVLQGVLPKFQADRYAGRNVYKRKMSQAIGIYNKLLDSGETDEARLADAKFEITRFDAIQASKKRTMNSTYGASASPTYRLYALIVAITITALARLCIVRTAIMQESTMTVASGFPFDLRVIYGDTDSTMGHACYPRVIVDYDLRTGEPIYEQVEPRAKHSIVIALAHFMATAINEYYQRDSAITGLGRHRKGPEYIGGGYKSGAIEIKFEKAYLNGQFYLAKKYFGIFDDGKERRLEVKGHGVVRREAPLSFRKRTKEVMYLQIIGRRKDAFLHAQKFLESIRLKNIPLEDVASTVKLSKPITDYTADNNAVCAARRYRDLTGQLPPVGMRFAVIAGAVARTVGAFKKSQLCIPLDEAIETNTQYDVETYEEKFFKLVSTALLFDFDGNDVKEVRRALFSSPIMRNTVVSRSGVVEERIESLSSKGSAEAEKTRAKTIMSHFSRIEYVRCAKCRGKTPLKELSPEEARNVGSSETNSFYHCVHCREDEATIGDIEDLLAESARMGNEEIQVRKTCIKCQQSMGMVGVNLINAMIESCEARTCSTYIRRKTIRTKRQFLLRRTTKVPEDLLNKARARMQSA